MPRHKCVYTSFIQFYPIYPLACHLIPVKWLMTSNCAQPKGVSESPLRFWSKNQIAVQDGPHACCSERAEPRHSPMAHQWALQQSESNVPEGKGTNSEGITRQKKSRLWIPKFWNAWAWLSLASKPETGSRSWDDHEFAILAPSSDARSP